MQEKAGFRLSLADATLEALRKLAKSSEEEREAAGRRSHPPSPNTVSTHVVEALEDGRAVRVRAVARPLERWDLGGGIVSTGAPAAAAVRLLARGRIAARGVRPPEACVDPEDLFPELEAHGTTFEVSELVAR